MNKTAIVVTVSLVVGAVMLMSGNKNTLDKKRKGEIPLSNKEAQNYLNTYSDLEKAYGNDLEKAKEHWVVYGISEGRTFESSVRIW